MASLPVEPLGTQASAVPLPMPPPSHVEESPHKNNSRRAQKSRVFFEKLRARKGGSGGSSERADQGGEHPKGPACLRSRSRGRSREKRRSRSQRREREYYSKRPKDRSLLLCRFDSVGCKRSDCRYRHVRSFRGDFGEGGRRDGLGNEGGEPSGGAAAARPEAAVEEAEQQDEGAAFDEADMLAEAAQLEEYAAEEAEEEEAEEVTEQHLWRSHPKRRLRTPRQRTSR